MRRSQGSNVREVRSNWAAFFHSLFRRWWLSLTALLLAAYAYLVEPIWIEVTRATVPAPLSTPIKIAHLTDLHTSGIGRVERRLLQHLDHEKPDMILITGDTVSDSGSREAAELFLGQLTAPLGVYFVDGNWEHWTEQHPRPRGERAAQVLNNESVNVRDNLYLLGVDDFLAGEPDADRASRGIPADAFVIGLLHSPQFFPELAPRLSLALAGHTHGGQVRLPWWGPLWLPPGSGKYEHGWYHQGSSRMYVSRGIGMSLLPVRFLCRPELFILTLTPQAIL